MAYIGSLLALILCPFVNGAVLQSCQHIPYSNEDTGDYVFCNTGWITASTVPKTYQITYDNKFIRPNTHTQLDPFDVLCVMAGIQVDVSQSKYHPTYSGVQGCRISMHDDGKIADWVALVEPHTYCDFLCIAYRYRHDQGTGKPQGRNLSRTVRSAKDCYHI